MEIEDLVGDYKIKGKNQDTDQTAYKGVLSLGLDENNKIEAQWRISNSQIQTGKGFFKDDILVINFKYSGVDLIEYKGVVVYKCISKNLLEGFWSEKHGNQKELGDEVCTRISPLSGFGAN